MKTPKRLPTPESTVQPVMVPLATLSSYMDEARGRLYPDGDDPNEVGTIAHMRRRLGLD